MPRTFSLNVALIVDLALRSSRLGRELLDERRRGVDLVRARRAGRERVARAVVRRHAPGVAARLLTAGRVGRGDRGHAAGPAAGDVELVGRRSRHLGPLEQRTRVLQPDAGRRAEQVRRHARREERLRAGPGPGLPDASLRRPPHVRRASSRDRRGRRVGRRLDRRAEDPVGRAEGLVVVPVDLDRVRRRERLAAHRNGVVPGTCTPPTGEEGETAGEDLVNVCTCDQVRPLFSSSRPGPARSTCPRGRGRRRR